MASGSKRLFMTEFSLDLYHQIVKESPEDNAFMSPSSVMVVMAMVHMGAKGKTLEQMTEVLGFDHLKEKEAHKILGKFISELKKENKNFQLRTANRLFPHKDKIIFDQYIKDVSKHYSADTKSMDYTNQPEEARVEINDWVEEETDGKIKDLLAPGTITALTALVLANAIYFKGDWATQFEKASTRPDTFYSSQSRTVQVDMMNRKMKDVGFLKSDKLACTVLELPYKGGELSMVLLLPNERFGLQTMEASLTAQIFDTLVSTMRKTTVQVSLPRFKLESSYKLNDHLKSLGMTDVFDPDNADLSGMSKEDLYVSYVAHKAYVDVNEEGTEAAAATAAVVSVRSLPMTLTFRADHPFLFAIYDRRQRVPLFIGRVVSPTESQGFQQQQQQQQQQQKK